MGHLPAFEKTSGVERVGFGDSVVRGYPALSSAPCLLFQRPVCPLETRESPVLMNEWALLAQLCSAEKGIRKLNA